MGTGSFPRVKSGRGVTLTPHPLLVPRSRKSRAIPLLPLWAVRPVQSLSACTMVHVTYRDSFTYRLRLVGAQEFRREKGSDQCIFFCGKMNKNYEWGAEFWDIVTVKWVKFISDGMSCVTIRDRSLQWCYRSERFGILSWDCIFYNGHEP